MRSILTIVLLLGGCSLRDMADGQKRPNVVVLVADDLGIGDLGCYGNDTINTPNIDKLASEGIRLKHHLAAATLCTPSRAAFLTARYPARYGFVGEEGTSRLLYHTACRASLPITEITLGKALEAANYTTAAVGKWHLGMMCGLFGRKCDGPQQHGFQHFYGLPYTLVQEFRGDPPFWILDLKDPFYVALVTSWVSCLTTLAFFRVKLQWRLVKAFIMVLFTTLFFFLVWFVYTHYRFHDRLWWMVSPWLNKFANCILMHDDIVIEQPIVFDGLMQNPLNFSLAFIGKHAHKDRPFFLYHSFAHTHTPMFVHPSFAGRSKHGRYGDNVEELDAGVGAIMEAIRDHGLDENTLVYFFSDHGGHLEVKDSDGQRTGGYNGLYKGGKYQGGSEGGIRVPGIFRWRGHLPSSVTIDTPTSLMDMMPTILDLMGLPPVGELFPHLPQRELDGISIAQLLLRPDEPTEPREFIHHCANSIHALRWSNGGQVYKMFLKRHKYHEGSFQCGWGFRTGCQCYGPQVKDFTQQPILFDLSRDPYEDHPIPKDTNEYKSVVSYLQQYLEEWRKRVPYPPSLFHSKIDTMHSFWLQPFCFKCVREHYLQ